MILPSNMLSPGAHSSPDPDSKWISVWAAAEQGPYPVGNPAAQPDLQYAFADEASGANNQSFRLIVRPSRWGSHARIRLSNSFGTQSVVFEGVSVGLHAYGSSIVAGSSRPVLFAGKSQVTVPAGESVWSDAVELPIHKQAFPLLEGRKIAVSFAVVGSSGPMTWHAKSLSTSYLSKPNSVASANDDAGLELPYSTISTYFLDVVDMRMPGDTQVVVALGDSITDGVGSTLNGDDRWPDVLNQRLHAAYGDKFSVVNLGMGGNQIIGPSVYTAQQAFRGGPAAVSRIDTDIVKLSGVSTVIWMQGINDFSENGRASLDDVIQGMTGAIAKLREWVSGVRIIGATLTTAYGSTSAAHGSLEQDNKRKALNDFIRSSQLFDGYVDFDLATRDPASGKLQKQFVPDSTIGGPGDGVHPNRAGYQAMGKAIDLEMLLNPGAK